MPKIWVELDFAPAETRADIGTITVLGPGSKGIVRPNPRPAADIVPADHLRPAHHRAAEQATKPVQEPAAVAPAK